MNKVFLKIRLDRTIHHCIQETSKNAHLIVLKQLHFNFKKMLIITVWHTANSLNNSYKQILVNTIIFFLPCVCKLPLYYILSRLLLKYCHDKVSVGVNDFSC